MREDREKGQRESNEGRGRLKTVDKQMKSKIKRIRKQEPRGKGRQGKRPERGEAEGPQKSISVTLMHTREQMVLTLFCVIKASDLVWGGCGGRRREEKEWERGNMDG